MKPWTKLRRDIVESERMSALLEQDPLAYALYINAKATCDDYGRIIGSPRKFRAKVAPMAAIDLKKVAAAINCMAGVYNESGEPLIRLYEVGGEQYIEIVGYNEIEQTDWATTSRPQLPRPPEWEVPQSLIKFVIARCASDPRITLERYELEVDDFPVECRESLRMALDSAKSIRLQRGDGGKFAPRSNTEVHTQTPSGDGQRTVGRPSGDGELAVGLALDVDVDIDVENVLKDSTPTEVVVGTPKQRNTPKKEAASEVSIREDTPNQIAANACLGVFSLTHKDMDDDQCAKYYKAMFSFIAQLPGGADELCAWAMSQPRRSLGNGSKPERAIPAYVRKAVTAVSWQKQFSVAKEQESGVPQKESVPVDRVKMLEKRYREIRRIEDAPETMTSPDRNNILSNLAAERMKIQQAIGYEPD